MKIILVLNHEPSRLKKSMFNPSKKHCIIFISLEAKILIDDKEFLC